MHPDRWSLGVLPRGVGRGSLRACGLAGGREQRTGRVFGECGPSSHLEIWRGLSGRSGILAKTLGEGTVCPREPRVPRRGRGSVAWKVTEAHESRGAVRGLLKPVHLVQEFASECEGSGARLHGDRLPPVCGSGGSPWSQHGHSFGRG